MVTKWKFLITICCLARINQDVDVVNITFLWHAGLHLMILMMPRFL